MATKQDTKAIAKTTKGVTTTFSKHAYGSILLAPHITEKGAVVATTDNAYTFVIHQDATKELVAKAIKNIYNVTPRKITIARTPRKAVVVRGKRGMQSGKKKAYVFLKKGEKIEFV
jgi:large subunit ribosomal protein L23